MKLTTLIFLHCVWCSLSFGQYLPATQIDSLRRELSRTAQDTNLVLAMTGLADAYKLIKPDSAFFYGQQALHLARKIGYSRGEFEAFFMMGYTYGVIGNFPRAMEMQLKALRIAEKMDYKYGIASVFQRLGTIYYHAKDYSRSLQYLRQSKELFESVYDHGLVAGTLNLMARAYLLMDKPDSALVYAQMAFDSIHRWEVEWVESPNFVMLGRAHAAMGNYALALDFFRQSIVQSHSRNDYFYVIQSNLEIADIFLKTHQPDSCAFYARKAIADAQKNNLPGEIATAGLMLAKVYERNNPELAFRYLDTVLAANDSLYNFGNLTSIQNQLAFDEEERQYEIEMAKEAYRNRVSLYSLLAGLGVFLLITFILYRNNRQKQKANTLLQSKNRELEVEAALERVRSQTMAMHQSNDLLNVITVVGIELHQIGIPFDWVNILTDVVRKQGLTAWQTVLGLPEPLKVYIPYFDHVLFNSIENLSTNNSEIWSYSLDENELKPWFRHVFNNTSFKNLPDELKQKRLSAKRGDISIVALKNNVFLSLAIHDGVSYTEEQNNIIKRFGKVFEQAYTRFLDLQKAESQAVDLVREKQQLEKTLTELRATQSQLIQSEKLASLGELTAGIAHEIQNPLNFVNNFSELSVDLAEELKLEIGKLEIPAKKKDLVAEILNDLTSNQQKINHHGKRASSIVSGMLQHARTSTGKKEPTDLNALADEYLRLSYHGLRAKDSSFNAKMETDFDPAVGKVEVIPQDIGRVFLNLLNNAFYATQQVGATLAVAQHTDAQHPDAGEEGDRKGRPYEPTVSISSKKTAGGVEFRIRDNGTGIPEAVKAKIFQPFFTTKPTGQGTGLGLSLAYDIVTKGHGGTLEVETKEGAGTEFVMHLPAKTSE